MNQTDDPKLILISHDLDTRILTKIGPFGCCGREKIAIHFPDSIENLREEFEASSSMADEQYIAVKMCEENLSLIKTIVEHYESEKS